VELLDEEERKRGDKPRSVEANGIEARPTNWLVPVLLVSLWKWDSYGYVLMERTAAFGFEAMNPGTLYRSLRQMEKESLCESRWETSNGGGPARRMYSITEAGEAHLDLWIKSLEHYRQTVDTFFRHYILGPSGTNAKKDS
jgi:PadR family transcriptional regulator PadR